METLLSACLPFLLASSSVLLLCSFFNIREGFFGFPTSTSPGIFLAFIARLGPQRHTASWTEQLADSRALWCEMTVVGLPGPHPISQPSKSPFNTYREYQSVPYGTLANAPAFLFLANQQHSSLEWFNNGAGYSCKSRSVDFSRITGSNPNDPVIFLCRGSASR